MDQTLKIPTYFNKNKQGAAGITTAAPYITG